MLDGGHYRPAILPLIRLAQRTAMDYIVMSVAASL